MRQAGRIFAVLVALAASSVVTARRPALAAAPGQAAATASVESLPESFARILAHPTLRAARVGLMAEDVKGNEILLAYNQDELFAPASVNKLFTSATALWQLGSHFVWETPVAWRGQRKGDLLEGDLWLVGRGAPDLVDEKLFLAATAISRSGLSRVSGDLIVDDRYFDAERYGDGWPGGNQSREAYHAPISALMANFAAERIAAEWQAVPDPSLHFGQRFLELLDMAGVSVRGTVRHPTTTEAEIHSPPTMVDTVIDGEVLPLGLHHIHTIESEPLGRLVMDIHKFSNNIMAETLLKTLGAVAYGPPGTATKGLAQVSRFLQETLDIPLNSYVQVDGSGLSRLSRFSPRQVLELLSRAHGDFHWGPELVASLKISGLDGWNPAPFKYPPLSGELRVKSGHIRGVNTLGGYLHTVSGRTVTFCAMINDHRAGQWEVDHRMAEIAEALIANF